MLRLRQYLLSSTTMLILAMFGATAFAVAGDLTTPGDDSDAASVTAADPTPTSTVTDTVEPKDADDEDGEKKKKDLDDQDDAGATSTVTDTATDGNKSNHGHCVSYWAHQAKAQGLKGRSKGQFVSSIARDKGATSTKVTDGGSPAATCDYQSALDAAKSGQDQTAKTKAEGADHDGDEVESSDPGQKNKGSKGSKGGRGKGKGKRK